MTENEFNKLELGDLVESRWCGHGVVIKRGDHREVPRYRRRGQLAFIVRFSGGSNYVLNLDGHEREAMHIVAKAKR